MAAILVVTVKGNSPQEIGKNLNIVDSFMNSGQSVLGLISDTRTNPRVYYNSDNVVTKNIHDITNILKTDKNLNHAIRSIAYSGNLNKI